MRGPLAVAAVLAGLVATLGAAEAAGEAAPRVSAAPGTVIRWPGVDLESCAMGEQTWLPLAGECWFQIDLLEETDVLEVKRRRSGTDERALVSVVDYPYPVQYITLENDSQVHLSAENLERVRGEQKLVGNLWSSRLPRQFDLPLASPLRERGSGGRFGSRRFFNNEPRSPHTGVDYKAVTGEPVFSVADGTVVLARDLFFSGISAFIDHGDGLISMYFHFSEILVEEGERVGRGQQIGRVGQTGRATGPHLHFGVRWHGARIDPELLLGDPAAVVAVQ